MEARRQCRATVWPMGRTSVVRFQAPTEEEEDKRGSLYSRLLEGRRSVAIYKTSNPLLKLINTHN